MITNTVRAADAIITWRQLRATRAPRRQAPPRTEAQLKIRPTLTNLDLTPRRRFPIRPRNRLTRRITRLDLHSASPEAIAKHITEVVPDLGAVEVVAEDGLRDVRLEEAALDGRDLEGNAAGDGVAPERLAVGGVFADFDLGPDLRADGPEVDGGVALVGYDGAADAAGFDRVGDCEGAEGGEEDGCEKHFWWERACGGCSD